MKNCKLLFKKMLKKNDIVDVVSIGTPCSLAENKAMAKYLENCGLKARFFLEKETSISKTPSHEFASFSPEIRFEQLKAALNSDAKIIWCSRGGYGSAEIIPFLQKMKKPKKEKIFIGFSDISSVNLFLMQNWGWRVLCAPMLVQMALDKVSKKSQQAILDVVFGKTKELKYDLIKLSGKNNELSGEITGGCASVIAGNFGTKNQIDWKNKILFLEDEGEDGERLDRYFYQISTIIREKKIKPKAILLGNFLQGNPHGTPKAQNIKIAINKLVENLKDIPIYQEKTACLGHSQNMMPLVLGKKSIIKNNRLFQNVA